MKMISSLTSLKKTKRLLWATESTVRIIFPAVSKIKATLLAPPSLEVTIGRYNAMYIHTARLVDGQDAFCVPTVARAYKETGQPVQTML